jgi:hypothetical protein
MTLAVNFHCINRMTIVWFHWAKGSFVVRSNAGCALGQNGQSCAVSQRQVVGRSDAGPPRGNIDRQDSYSMPMCNHGLGSGSISRRPPSIKRFRPHSTVGLSLVYLGRYLGSEQLALQPHDPCTRVATLCSKSAVSSLDNSSTVAVALRRRAR